MMNFKPILILVITLCFLGCKQEKMQVTRIEGKQISISDSLKANTEIETFIKPYRDHVNQDLDSVISFSKETYSKKDGELNTAIGNLFADAIFEQCNPIFNNMTNNDIDIVLVNHGGIRSIISKGNITRRTAFKLMPFENSVVVASLNGHAINELVSYLSKAKRAHPIHGLKIALDNDYNLIEATINNQPIDTTKTYYVATNDYLYNGGDHMDFFKASDTMYNLNYKIRNVLLDYFKKTDTIQPEIDDRFLKVNNTK